METGTSISKCNENELILKPSLVFPSIIFSGGGKIAKDTNGTVPGKFFSWILLPPSYSWPSPWKLVLFTFVYCLTVKSISIYASWKLCLEWPWESQVCYRNSQIIPPWSITCLCQVSDGNNRQRREERNSKKKKNIQSHASKILITVSTSLWLSHFAIRCFLYLSAAKFQFSWELIDTVPM